MILLNNIHLPLDFGDNELKREAAKQLKIKENQVKAVGLHRRSVDARRKTDVHFCCSVTVEVSGNETKIAAKCKNAQIFKPEVFEWPKVTETHKKRPVVVGFGPAGMFAALTLARAGLRPLVFERGESVERRQKTVESFMAGGVLNTESNVQFGEGGAGTFSDGKLNTGIKNVRCRAVLEEFVRFGAPQKILVDAKPHVGTDGLVSVVKNLRNEVISLGGEVCFSSKVSNVIFRDGRVLAVTVTRDGKDENVECDAVIFATGHSARDTFEMLKKHGVFMERKTFSVGARIEHRRDDIDRALYGDFAGHPVLGAADYKLAVHLENGKGVYTFCMCPGGEVINSSSEEGGVAVNGMSYSRRDGVNSNSAVLVDVKPEELPGDDVLEGMYLQREIERRAFLLGNGRIPTQNLGELLEGRRGTKPVLPTVKPATVDADIYDVLPPVTADSLKDGITAFGKKIAGFDSPDALLTFPETRSSSPVRMLRREDGVSVSFYGLFPCGEGAGYAGGIMSAAVDGIKTAEAVISALS